MKNIKLSVLAFTVFAATVVSASDAPKVAPKVEAPNAAEVKGYVAKAKDLAKSAKAALVSAYDATKNGASEVRSFASKNKLATAGIVIAATATVAAAVVYRKQIKAAIVKAFNAAKNNPGKTAAAIATVVALGAAHHYGYTTAAYNSVASLFASKAADVAKTAAKTN